MTILGIETSCDETALALIETRMAGGIFECRVIESLVHSQAELHSAYGGVYPNLAKREHGKNLVPLLHKLLTASEQKTKASLTNEEFKNRLEPFRIEIVSQNPDLWESFVHADFLKHIPKIDRIAVTEGPGLEPTLWVGINFARMLSALWNVPVIPVNHMEGHVVGSLLPSDASNGAWQKIYELPLPAIALLISGGHTELVEVKALGQYKIIGQTKDDAVGEAFDKVARLLGLSYPGGPHIGKLAHEAHEAGIASPVKLPRPMLKSGTLDFSFSGLKTAVLYALRDAEKEGILGDPGRAETFKKGLAYEFEQAVSDTLDAKLRAGIEKIGAKSVIIGGGVSANHVLRQRFEKTANEFSIPLFLPSRHISGDNALMIALAGALDEKLPAAGRELRAEGTKRLS